MGAGKFYIRKRATSFSVMVLLGGEHHFIDSEATAPKALACARALTSQKTILTFDGEPTETDLAEPAPEVVAEAQAEESKGIFGRAKEGALADAKGTADAKPGDYVIRFGKYSGKALKDIPARYLNWCLDNLEDNQWNNRLKANIRVHLKERK